ncbi:MAG TPA: HEAT repeat domain-containing protein [Gemmatimonadaceae bacterium]|nr:HEAT repeat domain-containing protein [Gemmatimonadaceae bacterium]
MTYSERFVRQLDRLVRLLADHPDLVDEQKRALRGACDALAEGEVTLLATPDALLANGTPVTGAAAAAGGLAARLHAGGARRLVVARDATAADLLLAARAMAAGQPLTGLELRTVRNATTMERARATPMDLPLATSAAEPVHAAPDFTRPGEVCVPPTWTDAPAALTSAASAAPVAIADASVSGALPPLPLTPPSPEERAAAARAAALINHASAEHRDDVLLRPTPTALERVLSTEELAARLTELTSLADVNRALEALAVRAELAARNGEPAVLRDVLAVLVRQEQAVDRQEKRLAIGIALRRLLTPLHLHLLASLLPRQPEAREVLLLVLARAGGEGADAVIEHLAESGSPSDRRAYFNALVQLPASEGALIHMLGDPRWYVVRNAAELLGELELRSADGALVRALAHEDERVRRAAVSSLGRLGTRTACHALRDLLRSEEGALRGAAAIALAGTDWPYTMAALRRAILDERDADVRAMQLTALGRVGTDEAVALLIQQAAPTRRLLRRTPTPLRVAAVHALAGTGSERARAALRRLSRDREAEVAEAARRASDER